MVTSGSERSNIETAILPYLRLQNSSWSFSIYIMVNCVEINRKYGARGRFERVEKVHQKLFIDLFFVLNHHVFEKPEHKTNSTI